MICKMLRLFVNTVTADDKYSLVNKDILRQHIHMPLPEKQKAFSQFFSRFMKSALNFKYFQKKDDSHSWCISEITDSEKLWSDNSRKSQFTEDPSTSNMINTPKSCWNLNGSTFTIFIDHCEGNWVGQSLS